MKITIVLLLSILVALSELNSTNHIEKGLIFNGEVFKLEDYPYVVYIRYPKPEFKYDYHVCTGSLVKELYVLTAAQCTYKFDTKQFEIYRGSIYNGQHFIRAVEKYIHEDFTNDIVTKADLCVLKLEKPFPNVTKYIKIGGYPQDFYHKGLECTNIGFGIVNSKGDTGGRGYKMTTLVRHGKTDCEGYDTEKIVNTWVEYLCSSAKSNSMICKGDIGGPMICNDRLYGVCSFYFNYKYGKAKCGGPNMQTVHIFVNYYLDWVNSIIEPKEDVDITTKPHEDVEPKKKKKKKKKEKKKESSGNLLKPHHILHTIVAMLLYSELTSFLF